MVDDFMAGMRGEQALLVPDTINKSSNTDLANPNELLIHFEAHHRAKLKAVLISHRDSGATTKPRPTDVNSTDPTSSSPETPKAVHGFFRPANETHLCDQVTPILYCPDT